MSEHRSNAAPERVDHTPSAEPWLKVAMASLVVAALAFFVPSPIRGAGLGAAVVLCAISVVLLVRQEMRRG